VTPTFSTVEEGATAILPVEGSEAICWTFPMLSMEVSLSGSPQFGLAQLSGSSAAPAGMTTGPDSSIRATNMSA